MTEDDVPLNDPLGGWIHWNETPELAVRDIEVVRGGASDLYGSSAIGGVVNVLPERPVNSQADDYVELTAAMNTYDERILAQTKRGPWGLLGAAGMLGTDGYIQEAPSQRGPVDKAQQCPQPECARRSRARGKGLCVFRARQRLQTTRHNGTPYQFNGRAVSLCDRCGLAQCAERHACAAPLWIG